VRACENIEAAGYPWEEDKAFVSLHVSPGGIGSQVSAI
jgi:hypothetical protein